MIEYFREYVHEEQRSESDVLRRLDSFVASSGFLPAPACVHREPHALGHGSTKEHTRREAGPQSHGTP